jgi:hypothetical protein
VILPQSSSVRIGAGLNCFPSFSSIVSSFNSGGGGNSTGSSSGVGGGGDNIDYKSNNRLSVRFKLKPLDKIKKKEQNEDVGEKLWLFSGQVLTRNREENLVC